MLTSSTAINVGSSGFTAVGPVMIVLERRKSEKVKTGEKGDIDLFFALMFGETSAKCFQLTAIK